MMNKQRLRIILVLVLGSLGISTFMNMKMRNESVDIDDASVLMTSSYYVMNDETLPTNLKLYNNGLDSFDELYNHADYVLKVQFVSRVQRQKTFISKMNIQEVYKGNLQNYEDIHILEPCFFESSGVFSTIEQYIPFKDNTSYIVFLQDGEYNDIGYNFVSNVYGKFPINNEPSFIKYTEAFHLTYQELMNYDFGYQKVTESMYENVDQQVNTCNTDESCKNAEAHRKAIQLYDAYPEKILRIWEDIIKNLNIKL